MSNCSLYFTDPSWTTRRAQACVLRANGKTRVQVAKTLQVPDSTLKYWEKEPVFQAALTRLVQDAVAETQQDLRRHDALRQRSLAQLEHRLEQVEADPDAVSLKDLIALNDAIYRDTAAPSVPPIPGEASDAEGGGSGLTANEPATEAAAPLTPAVPGKGGTSWRSRSPEAQDPLALESGRKQVKLAN
jgi:hypothetical protein